jgi:hypothetical protein
MRLASEESGRATGIFWAVIVLCFVAPLLALVYYLLSSPGRSLSALVWIFFGLFALFLGAIMRDMVRGSIEYARYGRSFVQFDDRPEPGKGLVGVLELSGKAAGARVEFSLRYVQAVEPQTRLSSGMEQHNWVARGSGIADTEGRMPLQFMIPLDLPPYRPRTRWELAVHAQLRDAHFTRHFRLPVHAA